MYKRKFCQLKRSIVVFIVLLSVEILLSSCTPSAKYLRSKNRETLTGSDYVRVLIKIEKENFTINSDSGLRVINKKDSRIIYESKNSGLNFYPEKIKNIYLFHNIN